MISREPTLHRSTLGANRSRREGDSRNDTALDSRVQRQFRRLADTISRELPRVKGGTLLFCGPSSDNHVAEVTRHVASELAEHAGARVIVVEGDGATHALTDRLNGTGRVNMATESHQVGAAKLDVLATDDPLVDFLPYESLWHGSETLPSATLNSLLHELRQAYRYVVIAGGTVSGSVLAMLTRSADATYLVIQLGVAERTDTSSIANFLTRAGGRLLGCVATSVP